MDHLLAWVPGGLPIARRTDWQMLDEAEVEACLHSRRTEAEAEESYDNCTARY